MRLAAAWLTLKHHRFELTVVVIACLLLAAAAQWLNSTLLAFNVPQGCFDAWLNADGVPPLDCRVPVNKYLEFLYANTYWFDPAMLILPFAAGTIAGVPLVARELESRTAQTAWSLSPSRTRWLLYQLWPVMLVGGAAVAIAAISASVLHDTRINGFPPGVFEGLGFHGPLLVARALVAFGVGLLAGAVIGRSLPAWIVAAVACIALVFFVAVGARQSWVAAQPGEIVEQSYGGSYILLEQLWRTPDGQLIGEAQAFPLVPEDIEDPYQWLADAGYIAVGRALTAEAAAAWEPLEIVGTVVLGVVLVCAAFPIVNRRRPS